jgi:hypothetical protein
LAANGAKPGNSALVGSEKVRIAAIADGKLPAAMQAPVRRPQRRRERGPPPPYPPGRFWRDGRGYAEKLLSRHRCHAGQASDADWLMYRRNYQGWSHSPLTQGDGGQCQRTAIAMVLGDE